MFLAVEIPASRTCHGFAAVAAPPPAAAVTVQLKCQTAAVLTAAVLTAAFHPIVVPAP